MFTHWHITGLSAVFCCPLLVACMGPHIEGGWHCIYSFTVGTIHVDRIIGKTLGLHGWWSRAKIRGNTVSWAVDQCIVWKDHIRGSLAAAMVCGFEGRGRRHNWHVGTTHWTESLKWAGTTHRYVMGPETGPKVLAHWQVGLVRVVALLLPTTNHNTRSSWESHNCWHPSHSLNASPAPTTCFRCNILALWHGPSRRWVT